MKPLMTCACCLLPRERLRNPLSRSNLPIFPNQRKSLKANEDGIISRDRDPGGHDKGNGPRESQQIRVLGSRGSFLVLGKYAVATIVACTAPREEGGSCDEWFFWR